MEEIIEAFEEFLGQHPMALKLEEKGAGMRLEPRFTIGSQNQLVEEFRIEKSRIRLSRFGSIAWLIRKGGNRDFFPHFEAHLKVFRNLIEIAMELIGRGGRIEGGIIADGPK